MKKVFKITGIVILCLLAIITVILIFLNSEYDKAKNEYERLAVKNTNQEATFYHFQFQNDSNSFLHILPLPKKLKAEKGVFSWPDAWKISSSLPDTEIWVQRLLKKSLTGLGTTGNLIFTENSDLPEEGYLLDISPKGIEIQYSQPAGAYYGMVTLHHLQVQFPESISCLKMEDSPDLKIRGYMMDISRDKIPQLSTAKALVDKLSLLKYNHLELYIEGFSFAYPSYKSLWEGKETPMTPEEIRELDAYCKARFIELVPNQNSLGHMQAWLNTTEFEHLAECPDGYEILPLQKTKTTLDPTNPESIQLVGQMMTDLLPNFTSNKFNGNLDEPFELGHCNSAALAENIGVGRVYLDYTLQIYEMAKSQGKEFWMWGDIIGKHPELIPDLPKDITVLEWGYEREHPFGEKTKVFKENGLEFMVCPGTSSWMTFTGRTDNMLANIENAVLNGLKNGAKGMLLTDWGDMGHWQYEPVSLPGIAYGGAISWNSSTSRNLPLEQYLNSFLFQDQNNELGGIVLDMGRLYHYEERHMPNMSHNFMAYQFGMADPVLEKTIYGAIEKKLPDLGGEEFYNLLAGRFQNQKSFDFQGLSEHLDYLEIELNQHAESKFNVQNEEQQLIREELKNGIRMVRIGAEIRNYGQQKENWDSSKRIKYLTDMQERLIEMQAKHRKLWTSQNKEGGLDRSMKPFADLQTQLNEMIKTEKGGSFGKSMERIKEKVIAGGVYWYLKSN
ncbi:family 20 glycosylhydrolase [Algoriphagus sp.]|uniref:beta-N-acetylhexosaminidase n=1 Tax=Algoriphagus sp. TaxID=1872435 RepID=UPI0025E13CE5|nr:family 20 glycosylhydrolase [Algoriphagus sp.]